MHELALSRAIVDAALRHAGGRRVTAFHVRLGALRQAVPGSLAFYFEIVAADTSCAGARLELEPVAALLRCVECGREWDPDPAPLAEHEEALPPLPCFRCPDCGGAGEELAGNELEVAWIEVEEEAPVGGAPPE
jgi:hydrogenase nickel incorporation protein HypA/HybF